MSRVLIVDDSATDRRLAGGLLEKAGVYELIFAHDGREAMTEIAMHSPQVVVTDLHMPNMDGLELVKAAREEYPLIPVIIMTSKGSEEVATEALQRGAASYVPKRLLAQQLLEVVERAISTGAEDRSLARLMTAVEQTHTTFTLENDLEMIATVVSYLVKQTRELGVCDDHDQLRVGMALDEALLNAYYHGNLEVSSDLREVDHRAYYQLADERRCQSPWQERRIRVEARLSAAEAVFEVSDEGEGFDPAALPDPTDPANLDRPCGRGVLLMRTFMDDVHYNDRGNAVTMVKRRMSAN